MSQVRESTPEDVEATLASASLAASHLPELPLVRRAAGLLAAADAVEVRAEELVDLAQLETGLTTARLSGELRRTVVQLRLFADVVAAGEFLEVRIDPTDEDFAIGRRPDLRRLLEPVGPVVNFAASNFPFAFSVVGGDTAAALAAGCPVVAKAHPGHPRLSVLTHEIARTALAVAGLPAGTLGLVLGQEQGVQVLTDPRIRAATFTGSARAGQALARMAADREQPIPFFGELSSVNPVVVTERALTERRDAIAQGFAASVAGSAGQLCTKPGFLLTPADLRFREALRLAAGAQPEHRLLNPRLGDGYRDRRDVVLEHRRGSRPRRGLDPHR